MSLIIGIDPGSRKTGFGVIETATKNSSQIKYVTSGIIRLPPGPVPARLGVIFDNITQLIDEFNPKQMAIEEIFLAKDPSAAIKLGQARGAAIVAGVNKNLVIGEYSPRTIKKSVVGNGSATKEQVQHMIKSILNLSSSPAEDAADALAASICHAQTVSFGLNSEGLLHYSKGRLKQKTTTSS
jgi:crossover junction endodeoxyribonuclease RuvC